MSDFLVLLIAISAWTVLLFLAIAARLILTLLADAAAAAKEPATLPDGTLIEIGDAVFTPAEANKIVSLRDYWQGRAVGNGTGGDAA